MTKYKRFRRGESGIFDAKFQWRIIEHIEMSPSAGEDVDKMIDAIVGFLNERYPIMFPKEIDETQQESL